ncbi:MAG: hypothetical protein ACK56F_18240, partial [bacterium]
MCEKLTCIAAPSERSVLRFAFSQETTDRRDNCGYGKVHSRSQGYKVQYGHGSERGENGAWLIVGTSLRAEHTKLGIQHPNRNDQEGGSQGPRAHHVESVCLLYHATAEYCWRES